MQVRAPFYGSPRCSCSRLDFQCDEMRAGELRDAISRVIARVVAQNGIEITVTRVYTHTHSHTRRAFIGAHLLSLLSRAIKRDIGDASQALGLHYVFTEV